MKISEKIGQLSQHGLITVSFLLTIAQRTKKQNPNILSKIFTNLLQKKVVHIDQGTCQ